MIKEEVFFPKEGVFSPSHIERSRGEKVCAFDLDDVLADSIPQWINYANFRMQQILTKEDLSDPKYDWANINYADLYFLKKHVPYYYYRMLKEMYRQSDVKKNLPVMEGAVGIIAQLKAANYKIVVMTKRSDRSATLTYKWLLENIPLVDEIIYNRDKHVEILVRYPSLRFMVEDNRDVANIVARWGYKVFLLNNKYNQGHLEPGVYRIPSLHQITYEGIKE